MKDLNNLCNVQYKTREDGMKNFNATIKLNERERVFANSLVFFIHSCMKKHKDKYKTGNTITVYKLDNQNKYRPLV